MRRRRRRRERRKKKKKKEMDFSNIASRPSLQESPSAEAGTSASALWSGGGSGLGVFHFALGGVGESGRGGTLAASRLSYAGGGAGATDAADADADAAAPFAPPSQLPAPIPQQQSEGSAREVDALDLLSDLW